jgi:hypothetical protein
MLDSPIFFLSIPDKKGSFAKTLLHEPHFNRFFIHSDRLFFANGLGPADIGATGI